MAAVKRDPVLLDYEYQSPVWVKFKKHLEARIALLRAKNDSSVSADKTEKLRGRIQELKSLLVLDQPTPVVDESDTE